MLESDKKALSPEDTPGVVLAGYSPGTAAEDADEGLVVVVHAVGACAVVVFPPGRVVVAVVGVAVDTCVVALVGPLIAVEGRRGLERQEVLRRAVLRVHDCSVTAALLLLLLLLLDGPHAREREREKRRM